MIKNKKFNKLKYELNKGHNGFMGTSHWLMTVCIFLLAWIIPWSISSGYIKALGSSKMFVFVIFLVIGGASLIVDLDSNPLQGGSSTAYYQLGFIGSILSLLMISISGIVYTIFHTKYDKKPESQHRMLFHAPIIPILIFLYVKFKVPDTGSLKGHFSFENAGIIFLVFLCACAVYLGSNMLIYKILKIFGKQGSTQIICTILMIISLFMMITMPYARLKLIFQAFAIGYLLHILEDVFSKGSAPLFFPIPMPSSLKHPTHLRFWWHPYLISSKLTVTTGGIINIILNYFFMFADIFLAYILFFKK